MPETNINMLQTVADGFAELKDEMVFVGGAIAELYASEPTASDIRITQDVDCVIKVSSRIEYARLEENLRNKGFKNDTTPGALICRWIYKEIKVDVMPTDPKILGFNNRWYVEGIANRIIKTLPNGTDIFIFSPEYYIASKFEAHNNRGGKDLRQSHDFEDIIYILENCVNILFEIGNSNLPVREYLKETCLNLLNNDNLTEGIEGALPFGSDSDSTGLIKELIRNIAEID